MIRKVLYGYTAFSVYGIYWMDVQCFTINMGVLGDQNDQKEGEAIYNPI